MLLEESVFINDHQNMFSLRFKKINTLSQLKKYVMSRHTIYVKKARKLPRLNGIGIFDGLIDLSHQSFSYIRAFWDLTNIKQKIQCLTQGRVFDVAQTRDLLVLSCYIVFNS